MSIPVNADSYTSNAFGLQIDGKIVEWLQKIDGLGFEVAAIEVKQNSAMGKSATKYLPGNQVPQEVTLVRGADGSPVMNQWISDAEKGQTSSIRKNVSIFINTTDGTPGRYYHLRNAWIKKTNLSSLESGGSGMATETVVLVHEGVTITG